MSRRDRPGAAAPEAAEPRILAWIAGAFAVAVPLFVTYGEGMFRTPKELLVRFEAILLAAVLALIAILRPGRIDWRALLRERWLWFTGITVGWTALVTLLSTSPTVSALSFAWVLSMAVVFAASVLAMRAGGLKMALLPLVPAVVNVAVVILQYLRIWSPFPTGDHGPLRPTGLVGISTDLGTYIVVPTLAAAALALTSSRWRRLAGAAALILTAGTFLTASLTAVGALAIGLLAIAGMKSLRLVIVVIVVVALLAALTLAFYPPVQQRWARMADAISARDLDRISSFRFVGFITAWMMLRDHPVTGIGPGAYGTHFLEYRDRAEAEYPFLRKSGARMFNFAEAHNDHLQVAAQTGLPGYLLLLASFVLVARLSLRRRLAPDEAASFAALLALPLALMFAVLALAQFPLELATPLHAALYYAAALVAWSGRP